MKVKIKPAGTRDLHSPTQTRDVIAYTRSTDYLFGDKFRKKAIKVFDCVQKVVLCGITASRKNADRRFAASEFSGTICFHVFCADFVEQRTKSSYLGAAKLQNRR